MILIACGDLHFTEAQPERRMDNYPETLFEKWGFIKRYARDNDIRTILLPGDIFDSHRASNRLISRLIQELDVPYDIGFGCIFGCIGNHDQVFRSEENSPMQILNASGIVDTINDGSVLIDNGKVSITRCNYGEDIQVPIEAETQILLIHKMISDADYWHGNVKYSQAKQFLDENYDFDIIISGDNHHCFTIESDGRMLLNAGSLGRKSIDQLYHEPCFFVVDTFELTFEKVLIPIYPAKEVFNFEEMEKKFERDEEMEKFIGALPSMDGSHPINYVADVVDFLERDPNIETDVAGVMYECLNNLEVRNK